MTHHHWLIVWSKAKLLFIKFFTKGSERRSLSSFVLLSIRFLPPHCLGYSNLLVPSLMRRAPASSSSSSSLWPTAKQYLTAGAHHPYHIVFLFKTCNRQLSGNRTLRTLSFLHGFLSPLHWGSNLVMSTTSQHGSSPRVKMAKMILAVRCAARWVSSQLLLANQK